MSDLFRDKLTHFIEKKIKDSGKTIPASSDDHTPIISAGLLESLHSQELAIPAEEAGSNSDLTTLDFSRERGTKSGILNFTNNRGPQALN